MAPMDFQCLLSIAVLIFHLEPASCYSNGKITSACSSMEPQHTFNSQTSPSPYHLSVNTIGFSPGDQIKVVLSGRSSEFEGFMLQARDAANPGPTNLLGGFSLADSRRTQLLHCNNIKDSAVSHTSNLRKSEVVVIWTAPANSPRGVQFFVTVVSNIRIFWVKVPGPIIYQNGLTPFPTQSQPPTTHPILPAPVTSAGCGLYKTCLQDPPGCDPELDFGCFFLSMSAEEPTTVVFELSGPGEGYIAFALSSDTWMGDDDVYMCVKDGERVSVSAALAYGRSPPVGQSQSGLSSVSWQLTYRDIQCRFSRPVSLKPDRFDLDLEYYLFLAHGPATNGEIRHHIQRPLISTQKKLITGPPELLKGSRASVHLKSHGALMLIAWMLTGSTGTFIASHFRSEWQNKSVLGVAVWFQLHRGLMMFTLLLTIVAFCFPFIYRNGWSKDAGAHPYLGCCVLGLSLIQPIVAALRPPPGSDGRPIFKYTHLCFGTVAEALAVAAMFLGSSLLLPRAASFVLIGYTTWLVSARIFFLTLKYPNLRSSWRLAYQSNREEFGHWVSFMRTRLLVFFVVGNFGFVVALLYFVAEV